jgi:hypothetical protein
VGIGTAAPAVHLEIASAATISDYATLRLNSPYSNYWDITNNSHLAFSRGGTEYLRFANGGHVLVGKTDTSSTDAGVVLKSDGLTLVTRDNASPMSIRRNTSDGDLLSFSKDGTTVGKIVAYAGSTSIVGNSYGIFFNSSVISPVDSTGLVRVDNIMDIGQAAYRFDDIYATNGTIQTSDRNEKEAIASLTPTEMLVAARLS